MNSIKQSKPHIDTDIDPPIESRTTKQLLEIIETKQQWRDDVLHLTQEELIKRGVSLNVQDHRRNIKRRFQKGIESIKSRATHSCFFLSTDNRDCDALQFVGIKFAITTNTQFKAK